MEKLKIRLMQFYALLFAFILFACPLTFAKSVISSDWLKAYGGKFSPPIDQHIKLNPALNVSSASNYHLPQLGSQNASSYSLDENSLGRTWLRLFRREAPIWQDAITQTYVEQLILRLLPFSGISHINPVVILLDDQNINAFAVPGGVIGVNMGLFLYAPDEDAFASVLTHELGHLAQRHFARGQKQAKETQLPTLTALLAGVAAAALGHSPDAGVAAIFSSQAAQMNYHLRYSRQYEEEADVVGINTLARAGIDPHAMPRMFRIMQSYADLQGDSPPEFLLTHPLTSNRISIAQARADQLIGHYTIAAITFDLIRARVIMAIYQKQPQQGLTLVNSRIHAINAQRYAQALALALTNQTNKAVQLLDDLSQQLPEANDLLKASAIDLLLDANDFSAAYKRSQQLYRNATDYFPAALFLARTALEQKPTQAFYLLKKLAQQFPENPQIWELYAQAAGHNQQFALGHLALAEKEQLMGNLAAAQKQLSYAKKLTSNDDSELKTQIKHREKDFNNYQQQVKDFH